MIYIRKCESAFRWNGLLTSSGALWIEAVTLPAHFSHRRLRSICESLS